MTITNPLTEAGLETRIGANQLKAIAGSDAAIRSARIKAVLDDSWAEVEARLAAFTYTAAPAAMIAVGYDLAWARLFTGGANDATNNAASRADQRARAARTLLQAWSAGTLPLAGSIRKSGSGAEALGTEVLL
ncbi:MAG: hypothetical protein AAF418_04840 [Pseudomonadota bacterium]